MAIVGTASCFSIGAEAHSIGGIHTWNCKPSEKPVTAEVVGPMEGSTTGVVLNLHIVKLPCVVEFEGEGHTHTYP